MKAIIAVNNLGFIGFDDGLPWRCSEDLRHFKSNLKLWDKCLVGYTTYQGLPDKVKERLELFVDLRDGEMTDKELSGIKWCIGGKKTYEKYCHLFTELHISRINNNSIGDTNFPDLRNINPKCEIYIYDFN